MLRKDGWVGWVGLGWIYGDVLGRRQDRQRHVNVNGRYYKA